MELVQKFFFAFDERWNLNRMMLHEISDLINYDADQKRFSFCLLWERALTAKIQNAGHCGTRLFSIDILKIKENDKKMKN